MDIHAYRTDALTPVDRAEATRVAAEYLPADQPGHDRKIVEFADGFAVFAVQPLHAPPDRPIPIGGSVYVIDKATGAVSFWPTYPPGVIAAHYGLLLAADRLIVADEWPELD
ncbi:hypothetical protein ACFWUP_12540 [Nocardia sp. NPDC058658]|uniref:hypothetical protein n=1 Tax=Nocardia sp. NPDC058658 TaxID=3346580 RepID=UPI00364FD4BB